MAGAAVHVKTVPMAPALTMRQAILTTAFGCKVQSQCPWLGRYISSPPCFAWGQQIGQMSSWALLYFGSVRCWCDATYRAWAVSVTRTRSSCSWQAANSKAVLSEAAEKTRPPKRRLRKEANLHQAQLQDRLRRIFKDGLATKCRRSAPRRGSWAEAYVLKDSCLVTYFMLGGTPCVRVIIPAGKTILE